MLGERELQQLLELGGAVARRAELRDQRRRLGARGVELALLRRRLPLQLADRALLAAQRLVGRRELARLSSSAAR